jgi:hypothetical protein
MGKVKTCGGFGNPSGLSGFIPGKYIRILMTAGLGYFLKRKYQRSAKLKVWQCLKSHRLSDCDSFCTFAIFTANREIHE